MSALVKIVVKLPKRSAMASEYMWAKRVGTDLYEIRNSPFFAYDLNYLDVVCAHAPDDACEPIVLRCVRRSGNRTLRVLFHAEVDGEEQLSLLRALEELGVVWEAADDRLFSLTVPPEGLYADACECLRDWQEADLLDFETCDSRDRYGLEVPLNS